jgi:hypothetical protein
VDQQLLGLRELPILFVVYFLPLGGINLYGDNNHEHMEPPRLQDK